MAEWCDDERNVHVFLKHEPPLPFPNNIWKEVHEYLQECSRNSYNEIKYVEYEFEPICQTELQDDEFDTDDDFDNETTELNEDIEYNSEYAYI